MHTSENGWDACEDRAEIGVEPLTVEGVEFPAGVRCGDVAAVLGYVAQQFHARVEPLGEGCWGHAFRPITNASQGRSTTMSNHSSGTAIDINAPKHPQGKAGTFSDAQVGEIRRILDEVGQSIRWGGDYSGGDVDEMHFEVYASDGELARVAASLCPDPVPAPDQPAAPEGLPAAPTPEPRGGPAAPRAEDAAGPPGSGLPAAPEPVDPLLQPTLKSGDQSDQVLDLQNRLNTGYPAYSALTVDGSFGPETEAVVRTFQQRAGIPIDGVCGPDTWAALIGGPSS